MNQARIAFAKFPEVKQVVSQVGRPDDGTDTAGFYNTEYFVDLRPKEEWRPMFNEDKVKLIETLNSEVSKIPGVVWNFSQPIADNMEEAVSGVKGELAVKIYGTDLKLLEQKGDEIVSVMSKIRGVADLGIFRVIGQPNLNLVVNRAQGRSLRHQRCRRAGRHRNRGRRQSRFADAQGRGTLRSGGSLSAAVSLDHRSRSRIFGCLRPPASAFRSASFATSISKTARPKFIGKGTRATSRSSTACSGATSAAPSKKRSRPSRRT